MLCVVRIKVGSLASKKNKKIHSMIIRKTSVGARNRESEIGRRMVECAEDAVITLDQKLYSLLSKERSPANRSWYEAKILVDSV